MHQPRFSEPGHDDSWAAGIGKLFEYCNIVGTTFNYVGQTMHKVII